VITAGRCYKTNNNQYQPKERQQQIMKSILHASTLVALLALALAPMPRALAAESADRAQEAKAKIDSARTEIGKIRSQAALTLEELNRLRKENIELRNQFQLYTQELTKMEDQAKVARDRAASMSEKGQAYFQAWEETIKSITNKDIREQAQKRYDKRVKSYNKIIKAMTEARDELKPFLSDLNEIKKLLDSELSRESVKSASGLIKQANWHGVDVVDSLKDVETELDRVSGELAKYE
jgi:septal ring factor EnvC (AmiA/AmiB activator)